MKVKNLNKILPTLNPNKRIKFQNNKGWGNKTMAINAIIEQGDVYIFIWAVHPHCIKEDLKDGQKLIWYNPNQGNSKLIKKYFPEYEE